MISYNSGDWLIWLGCFNLCLFYNKYFHIHFASATLKCCNHLTSSLFHLTKQFGSFHLTPNLPTLYWGHKQPKHGSLIWNIIFSMTPLNFHVLIQINKGRVLGENWDCLFICHCAQSLIQSHLILHNFFFWHFLLLHNINGIYLPYSWLNVYYLNFILKD